ncbi:LysR substrate-binding domain-containing protein [Acinetobacter nectaris]|uniref:LysR substrate-binding domain-containing protein n=1 Tax=Acinetobacter nectaris TaxID=1219382 RepID=UPI001F461DB5|nr:LysR substrate-binding domain-containing protein [Acinetobacter nectaris]MCF8999523.1 LysR family transcriptional regulator [Acinetobacter nectaris]MCF9028051.1 LysR family transcriptional regulator [Acinetobacter nectaris]
MIQNIELKWLYDLLTLEKHRSFTLTADLRHISQSSLSRRIQTLEKSLGFDIFDRNTSPLQLTEEGKLFILHVRNLLSDFEYNIDKIKGTSEVRSKISIASAHSLSGYLFPQILKNLKNYKEKTFHVEAIDVNQTIDYLKNGTCDFIISFYDHTLMNSNFLCHKLFSAKLYLVTGTNVSGIPKFSLEDKNLPFMSYTDESYMGKQVSEFLQQHQSHQFDTNFVSSMSMLLQDMIRSGYGVGWLPDYSIQSDLKNNRLSILPLKGAVLPVDIYLYRHNTRLNTELENFWHFIKLIDWEISSHQ